MSLVLYDSAKVALGVNKIRAVLDGYHGGAHEEKLYLRDDNNVPYNNHYYTSVSVSYSDGGIGATLDSYGYTVKFLAGERQPTEAEWDAAVHGASLSLADIGSTAAADHTTYLPIWIRIYCPGGETQQIREGMEVEVNYYVRAVGS